MDDGADGMQVAGHPLLAFAASVHSALDDLDRDCWGVPDGELPGLVISVAALSDRFAAVALGAAAEAELRDIPARAGASGTTAWLRELLNLPAGAAATMATTARAVRSELSVTGEALAAGRIGYAQAAAIVRAVQALPAEVTVDAVDDAGEPDPHGVAVPVRTVGEAHLLAAATGFDAGQLARLGEHLLAVIAPEIGEAAEAETLRRQEQRDRQRRELSCSEDRHGGMRLSGHLDAEGAQILRAALDPLSAPHPIDGQRDERTAGRRRGDALVELARRTLDREDLPAQGGEPPQVVIHIPLRTLTDGLGSASYQDGVRISPGLARTMACSAKIIPAVLGTESAVLDVGRAQRLFTGARRRAITLRDKGCAFPGCDRPPAWCDIHHVIAWWRGGRTDRSNAVMLCEHHHHIIHKGEWQIFMAADGIPEFIPPIWVDPQQRPRRNTRHG